MNFEGRVALVTGGGGGIGRAIALKLAMAQARVALLDRRPGPLEAVAQEISSRGGLALACPADVTVAAEVEAAVSRVAEEWGRVDILVNNAGVARDNLVLRMSEADWDDVLNINLKGAFLCTRAVLKYMLKQRWGRIVNIASVVGIVGNPGQANYVSSKAGLIGFTKAVAREIASRGITVNAVAPGFIDTDMTRGLRPALREEVQKQIPVGSFGSPEDVAQVVAFFATEEAAYITGQVLNVDGGMVMV